MGNKSDSTYVGVPFASEKLSVPVGVNEVQTITLTGGPTGGTWSLSYGGQTTAALAIDAAGATVETAFLGLSTVGTANATVTRSGSGLAVDPYIYTITGKADLSSLNMAQVTANVVTALTGGTTPSLTAATTTPGVGATPLTSSVHSPTSGGAAPGSAAVRALVTVEQTGANLLRYRKDGALRSGHANQAAGSPTAENLDGHRVADGATITLNSGDEIKNFRALAFTTAATLQVTYFR